MANVKKITLDSTPYFLREEKVYVVVRYFHDKFLGEKSPKMISASLSFECSRQSALLLQSGSSYNKKTMGVKIVEIPIGRELAWEHSKWEEFYYRDNDYGDDVAEEDYEDNIPF